MAPRWGGSRPGFLASIRAMRCFVRTNVAILVVGFGLSVVWRAVGLDALPQELGSIVFIVVGMLLVSLTDRELFWDIPPRHRR